MDDLVNMLEGIQHEVKESGVQLRLKDKNLQISNPPKTLVLKIVRLNRPTPEDIQQAASEDTLLVIANPSRRAAKEALKYNHLLLHGGYRIVAPGMSLIKEAPPVVETTRQTKLIGKTGVIAETLLMAPHRHWSVRQLAASAQLASSLVHRVVTRLEKEEVLFSEGSGPDKTRAIRNPTALAEIWSQEDKPPVRVLKGFAYSSNQESLLLQVMNICPKAAVGGVYAANSYKPVLTKIPFPIKVWVPNSFHLSELGQIGFQETTDGPNLEIRQTKGDPWAIHMTSESINRISKWRALHEIIGLEGRVQELAEELFAELRSAHGSR